MKTKLLILFLSLGIIVSCNMSQDNVDSRLSGAYEMDRSILPIQPPSTEPITEMDARNVEKPELFEVKAPEGAPNIVFVMIDDIGFGATNTFGG